VLDMSGNVWELCWNDYRNPEVIDGYGNGQPKVLRGGSWLVNLSGARAVCRDDHRPSNRNLIIGFRVCVSSLFF
jgi:formylglycine-generating enzyme required for sulfatase activity